MKRQGFGAGQQGVVALGQSNSLSLATTNEKAGFGCRSARRGSAWPITTACGSQVSGSEAGGAGVGQPHLEARVP